MNIRTAQGSIVTLGTSDRGHTTLEIAGREVESTEEIGAGDEEDYRWTVETLELDPENCIALGKELVHRGVRNSPKMTEALAGQLISDLLVWIAAALFRNEPAEPERDWPSWPIEPVPVTRSEPEAT